MPRRASCNCGSCPKCVDRKRKKEAYAKLTLEERRALRKRRDPVKTAISQRRARKRHRARNPEKVRARELVNQALKSGRLVKGKCEVCGSVDSEAHHDDYREPLRVRWLCKPHHPKGI